MLFLSNNDIEYVFPGVFDGLGNLQVLDLDQNSLFHIYLELFEPLQNLTNLYPRSNRLNSIKASVLPNPLVSLRILDLSDNGLATVEKPFSESFLSLQILRLNRNNLGEYFAPSDRYGRLGSGLTKLEEIYISSNSIQNLPKMTFRDQVSLKLLNISKILISSWGLDVFKFTKNIKN